MKIHHHPTPTLWFPWRPVAVGLAGLALVAGATMACEVTDSEGSELDARQLDALSDLGVAGVVGTEDGLLLLDAAGNDLGSVSRVDATVEVTLGETSAGLARRGLALWVDCDSMDAPLDIGAPGELTSWLADAAVGVDCARALRVGQIVSELDDSHAPGCETIVVGDVERLSCAATDPAQAQDFRLMSSGGDCGCVEDFTGYCAPECWTCIGNDPFETCGDGGGGIGGGGGGGGGGPICGDSTTFQGNGAAHASGTPNPQATAMRRAREDAGDKCLESDDDFILCTAVVTSVIDGTCYFDSQDNEYRCVATAYCAYDLL